jgi:hypothetical protein
MVKIITLSPDTIKLERLDRTKFKIVESSLKKKMIYVFRCHDVTECELWIYHIMLQLDNVNKSSPGKMQNLDYKYGSQSMV